MNLPFRKKKPCTKKEHGVNLPFINENLALKRTWCEFAI